MQKQDTAPLPVTPKLQPGEICPHKERCIIDYKAISRQIADNYSAVRQFSKKTRLRQHLRRKPGSKLQQIITAGRQQCAHECHLRGNFQHRHQHDIAYQGNQRNLVKIINLQRQYSQLCCQRNCCRLAYRRRQSLRQQPLACRQQPQKTGRRPER